MKSIFQRSFPYTSFKSVGTLTLLLGVVSGCHSTHVEAQASAILTQSGYTHTVTSTTVTEDNRQNPLSIALRMASATDIWHEQPVATLPVQATQIGLSREGRQAIVIVDSRPEADGNCIELWDMQTQERVLGIPSDASTQFETVAISNDGSKIAAVSQNAQSNELSLLIWDLTSNQPPKRERLSTIASALTVSDIKFSPDDTAILTKIQSEPSAEATEQILRLHDSTTAEVLHTLAPVENMSVGQVTFSPDSEQLVGVSRAIRNAQNEWSGSAVVLWQVSSGQLISSFSLDEASADDDGVSNELDYAAAISFTPSGQLKTLLNRNLVSNQLFTWNLSTPNIAPQVQVLPEVDRQDFTHILSPDGSYHFMSGDVAGARLLNTQTLEVVRINERVKEAVFSADGDSFAIATQASIQLFSKQSHTRITE